MQLNIFKDTEKGKEKKRKDIKKRDERYPD